MFLLHLEMGIIAANVSHATPHALKPDCVSEEYTVGLLILLSYSQTESLVHRILSIFNVESSKATSTMMMILSALDPAVIPRAG